MRRALLIVGKAPEPGRTKTRLVPLLSAEDAAALYRGFLLDCVNIGLDLGWERVSIIHPIGGAAALAEFVPPQVALFEQSGQGLGDALASAFAAHLKAGFDRVVLISSDNPTLSLEPIRQACAALADHDLSIGPTADGGYYLIGLRAPHPRMFEAIDWSTPRVYTQTLSRARGLGLRVHAVQEWYDVDEPQDLERLRHELLTSPRRIAPHTRAMLEQISLAAAPTG